MKIQSLNGIWMYRVGKGKFTEKSVPYSHLAVGHTECERTFDVNEFAEKVFLKFDGITYYAKVWLNDRYLGEMLPYSEYTFDVTELVRQKDNFLHVELEDTEPKFGPTDGWENFGGIIRDVSLVFKNESYIEDVFFKSVFGDDYKNALVTVETKTGGKCEGTGYEIQLFDEENLVLSYKQWGQAQSVKLENVKMWSPDCPKLYSLNVKLLKDSQVLDTYECNVGFRELKCSRHRFVLNGKDIYLKGICKHEAVGDSGHCPTYDEIYSDLKMIKDMGCNFVRLVHYPHNKVTLDIADKLGLMVSEEPGLWWSDTADKEVASGSLEVLKRTILRDRNHVSIAFWLSFNECRFTEKFLVDSAEICRKYDPTRLVSGANCMNDGDTLVYYNKCGFDFYTMHPYAPTTDRAKKSAGVLNDKPLLFTEWGGFYVYNNPHLLTDFLTDFYNLYLQNSDEGALAGSFFWFFAELNDFNRGEPACTDGVLHEGVVDKYRKPTLIYDAFVKCMKLGEESDNRNGFELACCDDAVDLSTFNALNARCDADKTAFDEYFSRIKTEIDIQEQQRKSMRKRQLKKGPLLENVPFLWDVPQLAGNGKKLVFDCRKKTDGIVILGLVTLDSAYPLGGIYGEEMGKVNVVYDDGTIEEAALRNGMEVTTAFALRGSSRIDVVAENAKRYALFSYDKNFEQYVINSLEVKTDGNKHIKHVEIECVQEKTIMIYGVYGK